MSESINDLQKPNTFTITTGHQLCLNTGPLYFIYKILQCIKITVELQKKYSDYIFVPKSENVIKDQIIQINKTNLNPGVMTVYMTGNIPKNGQTELKKGTSLVQAIALERQ